ncbi:MAG: hypothetical protein APF77_15565 [Clostridia bacterium BRH_c25]|nr:MAG: hypothetical protein APF77_15565 [Clostridia bacterium BRH_c25]
MYIKEMVEDLNSVLDLDRHIVGIKFIFNKEEFELSDAPQVRYKLSYCNMVKFAASGKSYKANLSNFLCIGSAKALGLIKPDSNAISGNVYYSFGLYDSLCTARNVQKDVTFLDHETYGVVVMPLEKFNVQPDIVICIINPYQSMRILQGYAFHHGAAKNIKMAGNSGICSECTATPYDTSDMNLSLLCSNTRFAAKWKDDELGVGMPFKMFEKVYDGVLKTIDPCELNDRKVKIIARCKDADRRIDINLDSNYFESTLKQHKIVEAHSKEPLSFFEDAANYD